MLKKKEISTRRVSQADKPAVWVPLDMVMRIGHTVGSGEVPVPTCVPREAAAVLSAFLNYWLVCLLPTNL